LSLFRPSRAAAGVAVSCALAALAAAPAGAVNTVTTSNGAQWQIHDAAAPALDSGSIRSITGNAFYGYGSIRVRVSDVPASDPSGRFNGEMMRGFGLRYDGVDSFASTRAVTLGGLAMARSIKVSKPGNYTRFFDSFTNTSNRTITADVSFGGTVGFNTTGNQTSVVDSSSGNAAIGATDAWVEVAVPPASGRLGRGPSATVLGTPSPFGGALSGTGNHQYNPFTVALPTTGLEANFHGFKNQLIIPPGRTQSLLHYAVAGIAETAGTAGTQTPAVKATAVSLAATPDLTDLSTGQRCTVTNFDIATTPGFDPVACAAATVPDVPAQPDAKPLATTSPYDVVNKSITQLGADMAAGVTTSQEITRAYLDRIAAYDVGPFGFHTYITVAHDAMAQAKAADQARAEGKTGDLLGIPVNIKDLYDTKDMPTTDGSLAFEGWQPAKDAFQVARLRAAGAVILGKGNLSEFANSGSCSESGYGMTWNAFKPSKTSLGSSGGPAVATALSLAGFGMGTQTGVSLYAPSTGASLASLRGTDGISSGSGVMPLTYLQDFEGPIARTTSDIARILNVTTGTDPGDPATVHADADARRPADWKAYLDPDALQGKRIGYVPAAFDTRTSSSYGQNDGTTAALMARFTDLEAAGATMVPITAPTPSSPPLNPPLVGSRTEEGWQHYFDQQVNPPFTTAGGPNGILNSPKVLPYNRNTGPFNPAPARLASTEVERIMKNRDDYKALWKTYMDTAGVDAIVYPGFRSDVYDNDGAQSLSSDRGTNVPTSNVGLPTLILPVGANPDGDPMSLQFVGRAFDDAKMLGFGYALEQQLKGKGHLLSKMAPALPYDATATPTPIVIEKPPAPVTTAPLEKPTETSAAASAPKGAFATLPRTGAATASRVSVKVTNTGASAITGKLKLTVKKGKVTRSLGLARFTVAPGATVTVRVPLSAYGKSALKAKRLVRATAAFTLTADGRTGVQRLTMTLKK
jgi:amidase